MVGGGLTLSRKVREAPIVSKLHEMATTMVNLPEQQKPAEN